MPLRRTNSSSSVVVVHSANIREDREALVAIFPDKFKVVKHASVASESLQWEDQFTLVLIPCVHAKGTFSVLVIDEDEIRKASERAKLFGVSSDEKHISGLITGKLTLLGGASLLLSPHNSWKDEEIRSATITTAMLAPAAGPMSPMGKRSTLKMQRSSSMPEIVPTQRITAINRMFPSLRIQAMGKKSAFESFPLNSRGGVPIETDLFVGKLLLVIRPSNPTEDPYWNNQVFATKKRRVMMQLQGKLKYTPSGELFAGMEISDPMKLGLLASGLCNLILKMTSKFNSELHYSFGDDKQRAHICFPASTFFEEFVVTPEGESPPPLGTVFQEDASAAKRRKAYTTKVSWNTTDTYSMAFHTMYIDFPTWSVVQLPIGRDVTLQTFWGNSSASIVMYECEPKAKKHITSELKYVAAIQMEFLGKDAEDSLPESERLSESEQSEDDLVEVDLDINSISTAGEASQSRALGDDLQNDDDDLEFFDAMQSESILPPSLDKGLSNISAASSHAAIMRLIDKSCPCVIDMLGEKGKYTHVYAFFNRKADRRPLFRTCHVSQELLGDRFLAEIDDAIFTHRLSPIEMTRRRIGLRYAEALMGKASPAKLEHFQKLRTTFDKRFLKRNISNKLKEQPMCCVLARAVSDRHWIEEWGYFTKNEINFGRFDKSKPYFQISMTSIVKVRAMPKDEWPLIQGYHILSIQTFGRETCLMFSDEEQMLRWISHINENRPTNSRVLEYPNSFSNHLIEVDHPEAEFLRKSSMWDCSKRKLLNLRKYSFRTLTTMDPDRTLELAEIALRKAIALEPKGPNDADLIEFLDCVSALKDADAHSLDETQRFAFFLNIYHVMIMHSFIMLGTPDSSLKWLSYFNTVSYQCADDIFSLAELEHNIIRANMAFPSQFLSRFVLPKSHYQFALTKKDPRINFALNCGSLSIPTSSVPIYTPKYLNDQLDNVVRSFIASAVIIKPKGSRDVSISLPRICQWFADDFGDGSSSDIIKMMEPYLESTQKMYLKRIWNDRKQSYDIGIFNAKFSSYNFECRFLTLLET